MKKTEMTKTRQRAISLLKHCGFLFPDDKYLKMLFRLYMGYNLNLDNPRTFQEKLQWLKLYNRRQEYVTMVDKYAAKEYVKGLLGEQYVVPTIAVWDRPEEIDWDKLPNQFVLKTTHGGGSIGVAICKDKASFDKDKAIKQLSTNLKFDIYDWFREWQYHHVPRRILAEQYLSDDSTSVKGDLNDYKFYCFNGVVTYCEVITGRRTKKQIDFFDLNWNHMPFTFEGREFADNQVPKPDCFDEMIYVAGKLCKDLPFSRIDLYVVNGRVYFGEITFFPASGFRYYSPEEWNMKLGDMIELPQKTR